MHSGCRARRPEIHCSHHDFLRGGGRRWLGNTRILALSFSSHNIECVHSTDHR
jgi:hypothetical protein